MASYSRAVNEAVDEKVQLPHLWHLPTWRLTSLTTSRAPLPSRSHTKLSFYFSLISHNSKLLIPTASFLVIYLHISINYNNAIYNTQCLLPYATVTNYSPFDKMSLKYVLRKIKSCLNVHKKQHMNEINLSFSFYTATQVVYVIINGGPILIALAPYSKLTSWLISRINFQVKRKFIVRFVLTIKLATAYKCLTSKCSVNKIFIILHNIRYSMSTF